MYFTSFRCNHILFRWYTNKEWQRSFFMRQLQKVKVVKVKVESWEYLLNFQINWEETTTAVQKLCWILQNLALSSSSPPALSSSPLSPSNYWGRSLLVWPKDPMLLVAPMNYPRTLLGRRGHRQSSQPWSFRVQTKSSRGTSTGVWNNSKEGWWWSRRCCWWPCWWRSPGVWNNSKEGW